MIRSQYHFRQSPSGLLAWDVKRLIELSAGLPRRFVELSEIGEINENHWYAYPGQIPTCHSILEHISLIEDADLKFPIILCAKGRVMDGMHRVCKAILRGETSILTVQFCQTPDPDYLGLQPNELPYE